MTRETKKVRSYVEVIHRLQNLRKQRNNLAIIKLGQIDCSVESYDMFCIRVNPSAKKSMKRVCLSAGIHGDEPAGVEAILTFLENYHEYATLFGGVEMLILPCDNPFGYERNIRNNAGGFDLNQQFQDSNHTQEIHWIKKAIGERSFDFSLDFHEDAEANGFYLWERKCPTLKSIADEIIKRMAQKYHIERKPDIEGFPNINGVVSLDKESLAKGWTRERYLFRHGTKYCLTLETPVNMSLQKRVGMHLSALKASIQILTSCFECVPQTTFLPPIISKA